MTESDLNLLRRFASENSQDAFTEIVRRHVDLVYSAALRQVRSPQLAEEVAQSVFSDLARHAGKLKADSILTAWLYAVTRRTAVDVIRKESRRQLREQIAVEMNTMNATANDWTEIGPLLDDAMAALDESDRSVILLRYFENKSLREVGERLNVSDDAAQKRASRAVEQLREFFSKRRLIIGASGLAVLISSNAVQSAPMGLAAAISAAAVLTGATTTSATMATTKVIAMTTIQKAVISAALATAIGTGVFAAHKASQLHEQNQTLLQQQVPLAQQIQQLQLQLSDATNRVAGLAEENAQLESNANNDELLKLRGEVTQQSSRINSLMNDSFVRRGLKWESNETELRKLFDEHPDQRIPEMQFLTDQQWLDIAREVNLDSEDEIHEALGMVRNRAQNTFADMMMKALQNYMETNNGNLPEIPAQLKPFFDVPIDDNVLQRYEALNDAEQQADWAKGAVFVEKSSAVIDKWMDRTYLIGPHFVGVVPLPLSVHLAFPKTLIPAMRAYQAQNNGQTPSDFSALQPFITTSEQEAALENLTNALSQARNP